MRHLFAAIALTALAGCSAAESSDDTPAARPATTATPARFDACSLLTQEQQDDVVGAPVKFARALDMSSGHPDWICERRTTVAYADDVAGFRLLAIPSSTWAAGVDAETTPWDEPTPESEALDRALVELDLVMKDLDSMPGRAACELWVEFHEQQDLPVVDHAVEYVATLGEDHRELTVGSCIGDRIVQLAVYDRESDDEDVAERVASMFLEVLPSAIKAVPDAPAPA